MMMILTTDDNKMLEEILEREGVIVDALCIHMDGTEEAEALATPADLQNSSSLHHQSSPTGPLSSAKVNSTIALSQIAELSKGFDLSTITMFGSSSERLDANGKDIVVGNQRTGGSFVGLEELFNQIRIYDQTSSQHNVPNGRKGNSDRSFPSFYRRRTSRDGDSFSSPQVQQWQQDIGANGEYFVSAS